MKDEKNLLEEKYFKDVRIRIYVLSWIITFFVISVIFLSAFTILDLILEIIFERNFDIIYFLKNESSIANPSIYLLIAFLLSVFGYASDFYSIKKKPFAVITRDSLFLRFKRNSFPWDDIQSISIEGKKKLTVTYLDKEESKKKSFDLKWLQRPEDFLSSIRRNCTTRDIPYQERELTLFSQIEVYSNLLQ